MSPPATQEARADLAFERLYEEHRGDVYRFVLRDLRNPADAEDVTQTAFLNAYRALKHGDQPEKPRAWLFAIAQNVTRRRFRSKASRPHEVELDPELALAPESAAPTAAEISDALRRLRPNYRSVLVLREIGGLSYAEVAEELGLSVAAVETLIFRARRALREELAPEERGRITVGGIVLWPLSDLVSNLFGSAGGWFARQGLAAKLAAVGGAAILGTGAAVETGVIQAPGRGSSEPALEQPVQREAVLGDVAKVPSRPTPVQAERDANAKNVTPKRKRPAGRDAKAAVAGSSKSSQPSAGGAAEGPGPTEAEAPRASAASVQLPDTGVKPVDDVVTAVEDTATAVVKPANKVVGKVTEPVNKVTGNVAEPVNKVVGKVTEPVNKVTDKVADPVNKVVGGLQPATDQP